MVGEGEVGTFRSSSISLHGKPQLFLTLQFSDLLQKFSDVQKLSDVQNLTDVEKFGDFQKFLDFQNFSEFQNFPDFQTFSDLIASDLLTLNLLYYSTMF